MKKIETMEQWNILSAAMREKGYTLWQMQYSHNHVEGFPAWFMMAGKKDVEVVTRNKDVRDAIVDYNSK